MVRGRTQPSRTFFRNTNPQRNGITVLIPEGEQRVTEKSRASGQAETSWGEEVEREESSMKKPKIVETIQATNTAGSVEDTGHDPEKGEKRMEQDEEENKLTGRVQMRRRHSERGDLEPTQVKEGPPPRSTRSSK
jgi:hypothetical protein